MKKIFKSIIVCIIVFNTIACKEKKAKLEISRLGDNIASIWYTNEIPSNNSLEVVNLILCGEFKVGDQITIMDRYGEEKYSGEIKEIRLAPDVEKATVGYTAIFIFDNVSRDDLDEGDYIIIK